MSERYFVEDPDDDWGYIVWDKIRVVPWHIRSHSAALDLCRVLNEGEALRAEVERLRAENKRALAAIAKRLLREEDEG